METNNELAAYCEGSLGVWVSLPTPREELTYGIQAIKEIGELIELPEYVRELTKEAESLVEELYLYETEERLPEWADDEGTLFQAAYDTAWELESSVSALLPDQYWFGMEDGELGLWRESEEEEWEW